MYKYQVIFARLIGLGWIIHQVLSFDLFRFVMHYNAVVSKKQEQAKLLSKRLIRTNRINSNEAMKLRERLEGFATKQRQRSVRHEEQVMDIKANLNNVVSIREKMEVSPVRRKFLLDHGVTLQMKDVSMEDFITAVDNTVLSGEKAKFVGKRPNSDTSDAVSGSEIKGSKTDLHASNSADKFPLHLPLNMLHKKRPPSVTNEGPLSVEVLVDEEEAALEKLRAHSTTPGAISRPQSAKQQKFLFRVITPPIKGRHITEAYREIEEDEKLVKKLLERKKFHDRLKKDSAKRKVTRDDNNAQLNSKRTNEVFESEKEEFLEEEHVLGSSENKELPETPEVRPRRSEREIPSSDEEFDKLMLKHLKIQPERKFGVAMGSESTVFNTGDYLPSKIDNRIERIEWNDQPGLSKDLSFASSTSENTLVSSASGNTQKVMFLEDSLDNESEISEKLSTASSLDSAKWNELVAKVRSDLKEREISQTVPRKTRLPQSRVSRISHPTGIDTDEDIIYDARPDKSVAKGYATMQMKVGQRSVSICVPRFKNEGVCKEQITMRANAKSELKVEQGKVKKQRRKTIATNLT